MQTVIDQKLMCGIEFMQDSKNILLIAQPTHGDFPDVTRCIIEDGGEIFGKCQKFPDGLEFIYGIMENDSVNILRLILEEYAEENFSEKLYELRGERESIYEAALHNKDLVRILLDKPVDLRSEDIVNVFTKGLRNQNYDSLELILQKHQLSLDDFIVSQLMCLREVPEIAKNKQSNVILDKIEASNLRLSRRHLDSTDSGFEEVVSPDSPDLGATTLRDSTKATQLTATQLTNSTGHSVTA
jgi:hypothetical protein